MTGDPDYVEMVIGPPVETVVSALRHCLVARPRRVFLAGDFSGIQARTVLALAGQHDKTAMMAAGQDVYVDMAKDIYGRPIDKKKDPAERQVGKNTVLGCGFQMGWRKFKDKYCAHQPDEFAQQVIRAYREVWAPEVPKVWRALEDAACSTVHRRVPSEAYGCRFEIEDLWLTCRLPSGRKMYYFNPQPTRKAMPWDETDVRPAWTYQAMKQGQWKTIDAFGGQLTENVVCGIERDLMTHAMFACENEGFPIVMLVHDEIVTEPLSKDANIVALQEIMCNSPDWAKQLQIPIAVEAWSATRYRK
jgi:DNA polymerase